MWQKHCQLGLKRTGKVGQIKEHCWISGILMNGTTELSIFELVFFKEREGWSKRAIRRHSGISLLPQPLGARLFPEWFPKVRLAQCLWVRMLLPNAQGQDHPAELQRWDCHLEMWRWLLSPDTEPWARGFFWSFTTWWNFAWLEPVIHFYFQLLPFGMGPSVLCLSHLACILEAYKLSNFTGSQLERNSESGNTVPQVSPALDLHEI